MPSCIRVAFVVLSCIPAFITIQHSEMNKTKDMNSVHWYNIEQYQIDEFFFGKKNEYSNYIRI